MVQRTWCSDDHVPESEKEFEDMMRQNQLLNNAQNDNENLVIQNDDLRTFKMPVSEYHGKIKVKVLKRKEKRSQIRCVASLKGNVCSMAFSCGMVYSLISNCSADYIPVAKTLNYTYNFGGNATLACWCNKSENRTMWLKGENYNTVAIRNHCNTSKYSAAVFNEEKHLVYYLTVKQFDISDLDVYSCLCGFQYSNNLLLDNSRFIYKPNSKEITPRVVKKIKTVNITFSIEKVFPKPECMITLQGINSTSHQLEIGNGPVLYTVTVYSILHREDHLCWIMANLSCYLKSEMIHHYQEYNICELQENIKLGEWGMIFVTGVAVLFVAVFIVGIYRLHYRWRSKYKNYTTPSELPKNDSTVCPEQKNM